MDAHDRKRAHQALWVCASTLRDELDELRAASYLRALDDLTLGQIQGACDAAVRQCKWMPAPAELRELAPEASDAAARSSELELAAVADREAAEWARDPIRQQMQAALDRIHADMTAGHYPTDTVLLQAIAGVVQQSARAWGDEVSGGQGRQEIDGAARASGDLPFGVMVAARGILAAWRGERYAPPKRPSKDER